MKNITKEIKSILKEIEEGYKKILKENLVGVYVHGSLAMGCFNLKSSDVDILVVVNDKLDLKTKKEIIGFTIESSKLAPKKGIEMSIIMQNELKNFKYPTPFELHYSESHKEKYLNNPNYICGDDTDSDLAAHITIIINRGICLYGEPIKKVFKPIPEKYYIKSILCDIENAKEDIIKYPVYIILNLCRILFYLKEKKISSKKEGGEWMLDKIENPYNEIIKKALNIYQGNGTDNNYNKEDLLLFAKIMIEKIDIEKNKRTY